MMQRIPFARHSYQLDSAPFSSQRLVNLFAEQAPADARAPVIVKSAAGLFPEFGVGAGPVYAIASMPGRFYVVSGSQFFSVTTNDDGSVNAAVLLGDIGLTATPTIALGPTQVVVVSAPNIYVATHGGALNQVMDSNMPASGASSVCYLDGYFVFTAADGSTFFCSALLDGTHFDGLDFATSESRPDSVQHVVAHKGDLWLFGQAGIEMWYDAGASDFPFRRQSGGVLDKAVGAPASICELDESLWWLGQDRIVYRNEGYAARRVSTHAIEAVLQRHGDLRDISACAWTFEGHGFYALSLPNQTFVHDAATGLWHERASAANGLGRWRGQCAAQSGQHLFLGDSVTGTLYSMDASLGSDGGVPHAWSATLPPLWAETRRGFMSRVEVEMEVGGDASPGLVTLDWSDDGGWNFYGGPRTMGAGAASERRKRVFATRLGSFRQRVLRVSGTGHATLYGADADISAGTANEPQPGHAAAAG